MTLKTLMAGACALALSTAAHAQDANDGVDPNAASTYGIVVMAPEGTDGATLANELRRLADEATAGTEDPQLADAEAGADRLQGRMGVVAEAAPIDPEAASEVSQEELADAPADLEPETMMSAGDVGETARAADGATGPAGSDGALTQVNPDLTELARQADGATMGATDAAGQDARIRQAGEMMARLEGFGEKFYERGYRMGYLEGLRDAQQAMAVRAAQQRQQEMSRASRQEERQLRALARQQAQGGNGMPRMILVPQGTDMQALMRQMQGLR